MDAYFSSFNIAKNKKFKFEAGEENQIGYFQQTKIVRNFQKDKRNWKELTEKSSIAEKPRTLIGNREHLNS